MTDAGQQSNSLLAALTAARILVENHAFIRRLVSAVGIAGYRAVPRADNPYVIATRRDGGPALHIHYGYTNGFRSEDEIVRLIGNTAGCAPSSRKGSWYVEHPTNRVRPGGERSPVMFAARHASAPAVCSCH